MNRREQNRLREQQQAAEAAATAAQQKAAHAPTPTPENPVPTTEPNTTEPIAAPEDCGICDKTPCICSELAAQADAEAKEVIARAKAPEASTPAPNPAAVDPAVPAAKAEPVQSRPEVCDFVTVVECHPSLRLAKTWQADGEIRDCDKALNFNVYERPLKSFNGLVNLLDILDSHSHRAIIRGKWSGDALPDLVKPEKMRKEGVKRNTQLFHDEPHHWVLFDVDKFRPTVGHPVLDPAPAIEEFIITQLPPAFHNCSYRWNLTGSAGHPKNEGILKLRLAFWLRTAYDSTALKAWKLAYGIAVDESLFRVVQIHYTSSPRFEPGVENPVPFRSRVVWKDEDEVDLVIDDTLLAQRKAHKPRGDGSGESRLKDPTLKTGPIGAFCRLYPPARLIEESETFQIPFEYESPEGGHRLNFLNGSGAPGGGYITDCGNYIGNVHASDPFLGRAANSFDVYRKYAYGHLDEDDGFDDDPTCSTSYHRALEAIKTLPEVQAELAAEQEAKQAASRDESTAAYEEWSAAVTAAGESAAVDQLIGEIKADARLVDIHRDDLATEIHARLKKLSKVGNASRTLSKIKNALRPAPVVEAPSRREIWMLDDLALVRVGGRVAVLIEKETRSSGILDTMGVNDMRTFSKNHTLIRPHPETGNPVVVDMFDEWLKLGETRRYRGIEFAPDGGREGFFNLWHGFATEPVPGDCSRFLAHIREVICAGDEGAFEWVISWLADLIQHPGRKPGTALVLRGGEGAGKGKAFADQLRDLIGPYLYCKVSRAHSLTTNFNKHLAGKLLIFANESVWGGDRSKEGALKDMITEDVQMIEPKGLDAFEVKDFARLLFATNEEWAVPVGADGRRYTVLDVANHRKGDDTYFRALYAEVNNGGREAFMHLLATRGLSGFNVHQAYKTAALLDLKLMRLDYADRWLLEQLMSRHIDAADSDDAFTGDAWPATWEKKSMHSSYEEFARDRGDRHTMDSARFSQWLKRRLPGVRDTRPKGEAPGRPRCYVLANLATCRGAFEAFIGHAMDWGVEELDIEAD